MLDLDLKFLAPHRLLKEFHVLSLIDGDPAISQHRLAGAVGLSPAMVNNYIKEFISRGLVEAQGDNNRSFRYYLTPKGLELKQSMMIDYLSEIQRLYSYTQTQMDRRPKGRKQKGPAL